MRDCPCLLCATPAQAESDTPIVDAEEQWAEWNGNEFQCVHSSTARELERHARALAEALEIISGKRQCADNLLSNFDVAEEAVEPWRAFCEEKLK